MTIKESSIREYISNIDFKSEDWALPKIKQDMRKFLGEEPAIDVIYEKDVMITENKSEEFLDIKKVEIVFYDTDNKFKKLEFLI